MVWCINAPSSEPVSAMIMTNKITDERGSGDNVQKGHQMMPFYYCDKCYQRLAENFSSHARANEVTAFTDCETQTKMSITDQIGSG